MTFSGRLSDDGTPRSVTLAGNSVMRYTGNVSNTYTGTTTVRRGRLELGRTNGAIAIAGPLVIDPPGDVMAIVRLLSADNIADGVPVRVNTFGSFEVNDGTDTIGDLTIADVGGHFGGDRAPDDGVIDDGERRDTQQPRCAICVERQCDGDRFWGHPRPGQPGAERHDAGVRRQRFQRLSCRRPCDRRGWSRQGRTWNAAAHHGQRLHREHGDPRRQPGGDGGQSCQSPRTGRRRAEGQRYGWRRHRHGWDDRTEHVRHVFDDRTGRVPGHRQHHAEPWRDPEDIHRPFRPVRPVDRDRRRLSCGGRPSPSTPCTSCRRWWHIRFSTTTAAIR